MPYNLSDNSIKIIIVVTLVIVLSKLFYTLTKRLQDKEETNLLKKFRNSEWSSPTFINIGLFLGLSMVTFSLWEFPSVVINGHLGFNLYTILLLAIFLLGLRTLWITPFIRVNANSVSITPFLLKMFGLDFFKTRILLNNILTVTKTDSLYTHLYPIVFSINIFTKDNKKITIHTEFFSWEIGNALFQYLEGRNV